MQRRLVPLLTAAVLPALAAFGPLAAPASAASSTYSSSTQYVAMGDSYSAGLGTADASGSCGRSPQGYPTLWANAHGITSFTDVTCSGAKTSDVLANQISALSPQTNVVTITIGGNDTNIGGEVESCLTGDSACATASQQFASNLPTYLAQIDQTYAAIRQAAPNATVYVLGYPHLFDTGPICYSDPVSPDQKAREMLNTSMDTFDNDLAQHAKAAGFVFADARSAFDGHGDCAFVSWFNMIVSLAPLHPTAAGYQYGYLVALDAVTG